MVGDVLAAASRRDHPHHAPARAWLAAAVIHQEDHLVTFDREFRRLLQRNQFTRLDPAALPTPHRAGAGVMAGAGRSSSPCVRGQRTWATAR